jgi:Alpha-galactosidase
MFDSLEIEFCYRIGGQKHCKRFSQEYSNEDFRAELIYKESGKQEFLTLKLLPSTELVVEALSIKIPYTYDVNCRIFANGYQSWTDSIEKPVHGKIKGISPIPKPLLEKYQLQKYGDYLFHEYTGKRGIFHGYTYTYIRNKKSYDFYGSLSERSGYTIFEQMVKKQCMIISKDCENLTIKSEYQAFELFHSVGEEHMVFDAYFAAMNIKPPRVKPATGWTSWYNYYQNINHDIIMENVANFKENNRKIDIFQIDDGYQTAVGDWLSIDKAKFPLGMQYLAEKIHREGYQAGLWLAPFVCEKTSVIFKEKSDWLLRDEKGQPMMAGSNWSGFYALDFYHIEVREYLKEVFRVVLQDWGYDLVKLDFLYAVCLLPRRDKTRGQIMTEAMEFLRECVGDKLILGCGVPLGPSFGLVDYCRIGCDISLDWDDKPYMRLIHRERISTKNAIGNAIGRRHLDGRAFLNDPDVFLLREDNISLTNEQKKLLATVNRLFGKLLFTSDNLKKYSTEQFQLFDRTLQPFTGHIIDVEYQGEAFAVIMYREGDRTYQLLLNLSTKTQEYHDSLNTKSIRVEPFGMHQTML